MIFLFWAFLEERNILGDYLGDSENDLKINIFLAAVESGVAVAVDADVQE